MHDFDELLHACRRRTLKRRIGIVAAVAGIIGAVGALQWYMSDRKATAERPQTEVRRSKASLTAKNLTAGSSTKTSPETVNSETALPKVAETPPAASYQTASVSTRSSSGRPTSTKKSVKYRVVQFATSQKKSMEGVKKFKRRLEGLGLRCYIKPSIDGIHIYLRCYKPENFSLLVPTLKKWHASYFYVHEEGDKKPLPYRVTSPVRVQKAIDEEQYKRSTPKSKRSAEVENVSLPAQSERSVLSAKSKKVTLKVEEVESLDTLKMRFERYPSYETALRIADILYRRKAYDKAAAWARKANALNRYDERAWILFAKAEYAMGEKEKAKRLLRIFLDYKSSKTAQALLGEWSR